MTALELKNQVDQIIARECGIKACWDEHPLRLTPGQIANIHYWISELLSFEELDAWMLGKEERKAKVTNG